MIKKNINSYNYGNKDFSKIKTYFSHIPLKFHALEWYNGLSLSSPKDIPQKKILCSIWIQMVIKIM